MIGAGAWRESLDVFGELAVVEGAVFAGVFEAVEFGDAAEPECAGEFRVGCVVIADGPQAESVEVGEAGRIGERGAGGFQECERGGGWFERSQVFADGFAEDGSGGGEFIW